MVLLCKLERYQLDLCAVEGVLKFDDFIVFRLNSVLQLLFQQSDLLLELVYLHSYQLNLKYLKHHSNK